MFDDLMNMLSEACGGDDVKQPERDLKEDCGACDDDDDKDNDRDDDMDLDDLTEGFGSLMEETDEDALIAEALILEAYGSGEALQSFLDENANMLIKEGILNEKSIVRLDKYAKLSRAESQAVLILAKKNNDRDYKKLVTLYKLKKVLKDRLEKKYANAARRYAKDMMKKSGKAIQQPAI